MIAAIHLVWGPLGVAPLRVFLDSYRATEAGCEHELVMLFNNVDAAQREEIAAELAGVEHRRVESPRAMQDVAAYAYAASVLPHERLCFLNSYSQPLAGGWLAKLDDALDQPGAGLVGATGSWTSVLSLQAYLKGLPSRYGSLLGDRRKATGLMRDIEREGGEARQAGSIAPEAQSGGERSTASRLPPARSLAHVAVQAFRFPAFPAPHLRTNAFMARRETLLQVRPGRLARKMDAYMLESGRRGLTRQVERMGMRALVVTRDGSHHEQDDWPDTRTLWQGDQENLLVADNQTRLYERGSDERRRLLARMAWGSRADPDPSPEG